MRCLADLDGYSTVFAPGPSPCFILKSSTSVPKVFDVKGDGIRSLSTLPRMENQNCIIYADYEVRCNKWEI